MVFSFINFAFWYKMLIRLIMHIICVEVELIQRNFKDKNMQIWK